MLYLGLFVKQNPEKAEQEPKAIQRKYKELEPDLR
jgi:hypothetical protein